MSASSHPEGASGFHDPISKRLDAVDRLQAEHSVMLGALERSNRATQKMFGEMSGKMDRVLASVESIHQDYGNVVKHISQNDENLRLLASATSSVSDAVNSIEDKLRRHKRDCADRHNEIDDKLELLHDSDPLDVDTSVYASLSAVDVKTMFSQERSAREQLQQEVEKLKREALIHKAEKSAVDKAKAEWEKNNNETKENLVKLRTARYGMYGVIAVAIISSVATITVAIMTSTESPKHEQKTHVVEGAK